MDKQRRSERTTLLKVDIKDPSYRTGHDRRHRRFGSVNLNDDDGLIINDITTNQVADKWGGKFRRRKKLSYPLALLIGALLFFGTLAVIYVVSPPKHRWREHNEECPAQKTYCNLLGPLSMYIQGALAGTIVTVLTTSWLCERPRRPLIQFIADNSKSVVLALMTHFLAGGSAILIKQVVKHEDIKDCDWYFVIFIWDSFIGVTATIALHQWTAKKAEKFERFELLSRIGDYEARPDPVNGFREPSTNTDRVRRWAWQMLHWVSCALIARLFDFGLLYLVARWLGRVAAGVGWWACSDAQVEAKQWLNILVMPMFVDSCQFLIQNRFLKAKPIKPFNSDPTRSAAQVGHHEL